VVFRKSAVMTLCLRSDPRDPIAAGLLKILLALLIFWNLNARIA